MPRSAGEYSLPQQIIDLMSSLAEYYGGKTVVDPWCHFPEILRACEFAEKRVGFVRSNSIYNQMVHEEPALELRHCDVFHDETQETFDIVLWGPPWGEEVEYGGRRQRVEHFSLERAIELLSPNGTAICLVTPAVLYAPRWTAIRRRILEEFDLQLTVELTNKIGDPRQNISTFGNIPTLIAFRRTKPGGQVFMATYTGDNEELIKNLRHGQGDFWVATSQINDRWDRSYHHPKFSVIDDRLSGFPTHSIRDMGDVVAGYVPRGSTEPAEGDFRLLMAKDLRSGTISDEDARYVHASTERRFQRAILKPGDVVVSCINPKVYVYQKDDPPAVAHNSLLVIRPQRQYLEYLGAYLQTDDGKWLFEIQVDRKAPSLGSYRRLSIGQLEAFKIPILPFTQPELLDSRRRQVATTAQLETFSDQLLTLRRENLRLRHELEQEQARHEQAEDDRIRFATQARETETNQRFLEEQFASVHDQLRALRSSVDGIREHLAQIALSIGTIKSSERTIEEKLIRLYGQLDRLTDRIADPASSDFEIYSDIVRVWLGDLELLHERSRVFLTSGEQLFDLFSEQEDSDFSPFVMQYCRSLENELAEKLFRPYHIDLQRRIENVAVFVESDLADRQGSQFKFAKAIKNDLQKHTLGDMCWVLNLARPGGKTIQNSKLLQDFSVFSRERFGDWVTAPDTVKKFSDVTEKFRNQAAHIELLNKAVALDCQAALRTIVGELIEQFQNSSPSEKNE